MSKAEFIVDKENLEVKIIRTFNTTAERLWRAYTEPEQIVKWWADTTIDEHEFKVGGRWRFVSSGQDGKEHAFAGEFKEIDEPHKLVRTFMYEPYPGNVMVETVVLEPAGEDKTKMTTTSKYQNIQQLEGMVGMGMEHGAVLGLDRLAKLVEES